MDVDEIQTQLIKAIDNLTINIRNSYTDKRILELYRYKLLNILTYIENNQWPNAANCTKICIQMLVADSTIEITKSNIYIPNLKIQISKIYEQICSYCTQNNINTKIKYKTAQRYQEEQFIMQQFKECLVNIPYSISEEDAKELFDNIFKENKL